MSHERVVFRFKHEMDSGYSWFSTAANLVGIPADFESLKFWDNETAWNTTQIKKKDPRNAIYYCRPTFPNLTTGTVISGIAKVGPAVALYLISPKQVVVAAWRMFNGQKLDDDTIIKKAVEKWDGSSYKHPFRYVKSNLNVHHSNTTNNFRIKDIRITATQVRMKVATGSSWAGCRTKDRHIEKPWDLVNDEGGFTKGDEDEKTHFMTVLRYIKFMYEAMEDEDKALYWVTKRCPVRFSADRSFSKLNQRKHWRIIKTCREQLEWTDDFALAKVFGYAALNNYHRYNETYKKEHLPSIPKEVIDSADSDHIPASSGKKPWFQFWRRRLQMRLAKN